MRTQSITGKIADFCISILTFQIGTLVTLGFFCAFLVACQAPEHELYSGMSALGSAAPVSFAQLQADVLSPKCLSCHNGSTSPNLTSYSTLMSGTDVTPGNPAQSKLYTYCQSGMMPISGGQLSSAELAELYNWIAAGAAQVPPAQTGTATGSNGGTGQVGGGTTSPQTASFATINTTILKPSCVACHNGTTASGGYNFSSYATTIQAVVAGNAAMSNLYIDVANGNMPLGGASPLTASQISLIQSWINAGAPNN